jgi:hypothetical protein
MNRTLTEILIDLKNAIAVADIELAEQLVNEALALAD